MKYFRTFNRPLICHVAGQTRATVMAYVKLSMARRMPPMNSTKPLRPWPNRRGDRIQMKQDMYRYVSICSRIHKWNIMKPYIDLCQMLLNYGLNVLSQRTISLCSRVILYTPCYHKIYLYIHIIYCTYYIYTYIIYIYILYTYILYI